MKKLTKEQIKMLHSALVERFGGQDGLRDEGMLDSALNTPFQTFSGSELYPDLLSKAARLAFGLIANHPFIDGNKRIGTHAMLIFLLLNNVELEYDDDDLISLKTALKRENEIIAPIAASSLLTVRQQVKENLVKMTE